MFLAKWQLIGKQGSIVRRRQTNWNAAQRRHCFKNSDALSACFVVVFSTHFPSVKSAQPNYWSSYGCSRFVVYHRTGSWVCAVVQFERNDTRSWPEFMGVRGSACSSNDGESHQTSSKVMFSCCVSLKWILGDVSLNYSIKKPFYSVQ